MESEEVILDTLIDKCCVSTIYLHHYLSHLISILAPKDGLCRSELTACWGHSPKYLLCNLEIGNFPMGLPATNLKF